MFNVHSNHEPAIFKWLSGQTFPGHPVFGSWITYGLGSENENLPAYVVLADPSAVCQPMESNAGCRPTFRRCSRELQCGRPDQPLLNLKPEFSEPDGVTAAKADLIGRLDRRHADRRPGQPVLDARIANYEMAARMQLEATEALDIGNETTETLAMYGVDKKETGQLRSPLSPRKAIGRTWRSVRPTLPARASLGQPQRNRQLPFKYLQADRPAGRGTLERPQAARSTGRDACPLGRRVRPLPMAQNSSATNSKQGRTRPRSVRIHLLDGRRRRKVRLPLRQHRRHRYASVENRVSIQDWHATILHLLGLRFEELTFARNGLEEKLTHQHKTRVVSEILA